VHTPCSAGFTARKPFSHTPSAPCRTLTGFRSHYITRVRHQNCQTSPFSMYKCVLNHDSPMHEECHSSHLRRPESFSCWQTDFKIVIDANILPENPSRLLIRETPCMERGSYNPTVHFMHIHMANHPTHVNPCAGAIRTMQTMYDA
jgi:hypothetical protein